MNRMKIRENSTLIDKVAKSALRYIYILLVPSEIVQFFHNTEFGVLLACIHL